MRNRKKMVWITMAVVLICAIGFLAIMNFTEQDNTATNNMNIRKATPEEIENARTAKYVDGISTKHGDFEYTPNAPVPSEGVVYDLGDIRRDTQMVILGEKKFSKIEE